MPVAPTTEPASSVEPPPAGPLWRTILTPRWLGLLGLAVAIAAVMSVLGVWQLDVYQSKTAAATARHASDAPVALQSLFSLDDGLPSKAVGRRVSVTGTWGLASDQLYISDRRLGDRDGFWVVTPLMLSSTDSGTGGSGDGGSGDGGSGTGGSGSGGSGSGGSGDGGTAVGGATSAGAVMVIRGWVTSPTDPAAKPPAGPVDLTGSVISSEAQDASGDDTKARILQSLRIPTIVHLVDYRIYDAFVVLSSSTPTPTATAPAIVPPPSPPTDHAGLRNVAYAFQWWLFAAFTLWMWTRMVRDAHRDPTPAS